MNINDALRAYLELADHEFRAVRAWTRPSTSLELSLDDEQQILIAVGLLEDSKQFTALANAIDTENPPESLDLGQWRAADYLRVSGVYQDLFAGRDLNYPDVAQDDVM